MKRVVLVSLLTLTAALPLGAKEKERDPLSLRVSPAVAFAPANLIVRATVENNAANRSMEIVAESEDFYRSSEVQLDGASAPRTTMFEFRSLPPGTYEVRAVLYSASGDPRAEVRQQINVIASGTGN
jgi:hypothetical protein